MINKILLTILIIIYSSLTFSDEAISVSTELRKSDIEFYSQSNAGRLITCGVEFSGIDKDLNYFSGSYSVLYLGNGDISPIFKLKSMTINGSNDIKKNKLKSIWLKSPNYSTLSTSWFSKQSDESIISATDNPDEGIKLYIDITKGEEIKIGYLRENSVIDSVYMLKTYPNTNIEKAKDCLMSIIQEANKDIKANNTLKRKDSRLRSR